MAETRTVAVFLYGSARKKHINHDVLLNGNAIYRGTFVTQDPYYMIDMSSIPVCYEIPPYDQLYNQCRRVVGEVYSVDEETLKQLDMLEGHPEFFRRKRVKVIVGDGSAKDTFMYLMSPPVKMYAPVVPPNMTGNYEWNHPVSD